MTRGQINFHINGQPHRIFDAAAFISLSDYLRLRHGMIGTKIVCSEGDCGACTVLVANLDDAKNNNAPIYRAVDACITWMFQLDHAHVVTVEGLEDQGSPHAVQKAMVECHGSQCGFCTPGFVMATVGLLEDPANRNPQNADGKLDDEKVRQGLTGNLCRCTGYVQICDAARAVEPASIKRIAERYPTENLQQTCAGDDAAVHLKLADGRELFVPATLDEALDFLAANPKTKIVAGATDVGVAVNKGLLTFEKIMFIGRIAELNAIKMVDGELVMGSAVTWSNVEAAAKQDLPQFAEILARFGAPQIRNAGTVGGNIINASPIADSLPLLFVTEAQLHLVRAGGQRTVRVNDFYLGYKKLDLLPGEMLAQVRLKLPTSSQSLRLYKVSKRRDLDISTFTAAMLFTLVGERIVEAKLAYGGVGPVVLRLPRTEKFLAGKSLTESVMIEAGAIAQKEITPISDVRASAEYRMVLAQTILQKAYFDLAPAADAVGVV